MCLFFCFEEKEEGRGNVGLRARVSFIAIYVFKGVCRITMQTLHSNYTSRWKSNRLAVYSLCFKPYINYTLNYTLNYTWQTIKKSLNHTQTRHSNPTFCDRRRTGERNLEHESREWSDWCDWSKSYVTFVTNVTNVTNATNVKQEMAIGGDATRPSVSSSLWLLDSSSLCLFDSLSLLLAASLPPVRRSKNPTILSHFSAIWH